MHFYDQAKSSNIKAVRRPLQLGMLGAQLPSVPHVAVMLKRPFVSTLPSAQETWTTVPGTTSVVLTTRENDTGRHWIAAGQHAEAAFYNYYRDAFSTKNAELYNQSINLSIPYVARKSEAGASWLHTILFSSDTVPQLQNVWGYFFRPNSLPVTLSHV